VARRVAEDHTVSWDGNRWGVLREEVCAGLRGAAVEIERRLDGSHWLRYRGRYLHLRPCPEPVRPPASPSGLRPPGPAEKTERPENKIKPKYHVRQITLGEDHGSGHFYLAKTRTFLLCVDRLVCRALAFSCSLVLALIRHQLFPSFRNEFGAFGSLPSDLLDFGAPARLPAKQVASAKVRGNLRLPLPRRVRVTRFKKSGVTFPRTPFLANFRFAGWSQ
jgi:hypothetical protein